MANIENKVAAAYEAARRARNERALDPGKEDQAHMAAAQNAARLQATGGTSDRLHTTPFVNYSGITQKEADIITNEERKALGRTPPPDSLAAEAQIFAAQHRALDPIEARERGTMPTSQLKEAARVDAAQIVVERGQPVGAVPTVNFESVTKEDAARLQSAERQILGHGPPPDSLAAQAQSAADQNAQVEDTMRKIL